MADYLPSELIVKILSRLPSKSLLRCRSVCKSWKSLISSPQFIQTHLNKFNQLNSRNIVRCCLQPENREAYTVHLDDQHLTLDTPIDFPFSLTRDDYDYRNPFFTMIGCCNGVICLYNATTTRNEILLWNPSIRRKVTLTPPVQPYRNYNRDHIFVFGFGYCNISDDYKVVRLVCDGITFSDRPKVEIYTVKTATWKTIMFPQDSRFCRILGDRSHVFLNGSVHWLAGDRDISLSSILTLDISTELFGEIQLPDFHVKCPSMPVTITVVGDSLGLIYPFRPLFVCSSTYKIMVMKEYKIPTSWTLIYEVHFPDIDLGRPLKLRHNGDLITASSSCNLTIYNQEAGCYSVDGCCRKGVNLYSISIDRYQESLALLDVGSYTHNQE
ncbi:unnamed protein product [Lactuca virosa]|uniref:F-box domain-containing protein n=1 Tax=Lactuca virosa TaxID=75947 RepID=A0AAU9NT61_9ASTR|nr:unnamed protein product [Lactuca virosa]